MASSGLRAGDAAAGTALVRHAPQINGTIDGSIQQMLAESVTLNGGASITGDLLIPGVPKIRLNGRPAYSGTVDLDGACTPTNHQVTLNGRASLRYLVRRVDPYPLPTVSSPPLPGGVRSVVINRVGEAVGDWSSVRNLTLNGRVGLCTVPPGTYGDFTANGGGGFAVGVAGATEPSVYDFQRITLNGQAEIRVLGPVILTVAHGFAANGVIGCSGDTSLLTLNVYSGGVALNGGCALYGSVTAPNGTVSINGNSQLVGGVSCDRLIVNGGGLLRLIEASPVNQPPVANGQSLATLEDESLSIVLGGSDPEGAVLTFSIVSSPALGRLIGSAPNMVYQPDTDANGPDRFTFTVSDGVDISAPAEVSIDVVPVNDRPVVHGEPVSTLEDVKVLVELTGSDVEGSSITYSIVEPPAHGTLVFTGSSTVEYAPNRDYFGSDSFSFLASDGMLNSEPAVVPIEVVPVNDAPVATSQSLTVEEENSCEITLTAFDADGDVLAFRMVVPPTNGVLTGTPPFLTYRPDTDFADIDGFVFEVDDQHGGVVTGTVTIDVTNLNDAPVVSVSPVSTSEDSETDIAVSAVDADGDPVTFAVIVAPVHGELVLVSSGPDTALFRYRPAPDFFGSDSFIMGATDLFGADSVPVTVSVVVEGVNDAPVAYDQSAETSEDTEIAITLTGTDVDSGDLTFRIVTPPSMGVLLGSGPQLVYLPSTDQHGTDAFTFVVSDGELDSAPGTVSIVVVPVPDAPVAQPQEQETDEDVPLALTLVATDADGDALAYIISTPPRHGSLSFSSPDAVTPDCVYTPDADYHGDDEFLFTATDGDLTGVPAIVAIQVAPINDAPVAVDQSLSTDRNVPLDLTLGASDVDDLSGAGLTYSVLAAPTAGTLRTESGLLTAYPVTGLASPNLTYTPSLDFAGQDQVAFTASDGSLESNTGTVQIIVVATNRAPIATSALVEVVEDTPTAVNLVASDPDGDALTYAIVDQPLHGVLSGSAPSLTYTPEPDFSGTDSFTFTAFDAEQVSATARVQVTVTPVTDAPEITLSLDGDRRTFAPGETIELSAIASSVDSTVTRVEFFSGTTWLGEVEQGPFTLSWSPAIVGAHQIWARVHDDVGQTVDTSVTEVVVATPLPASVGFEATEGYVAGQLGGQRGWEATAGVSVGSGSVYAGAAAVQIASGNPVSEFGQMFGVPFGESVVFLDFYLKPVAADDVVQATMFTINGAPVAFVLLPYDEGGFRVGHSDGKWSATEYPYTIWIRSTTHQARSFVEFTVRLDYTRRCWDLAVDGVLVTAEQPFSECASDGVVDLRVRGNSALATSFDAFSGDVFNLAWEDDDRDNMDNSWESGNGLDPSVDDRLGDADEDGLVNILEYVYGADPQDSDSDDDGIPDGWEWAHRLDPMNPGDASLDGDHDGAPNWMEYQQGGDPWVAGDVTDGDELPDAWELRYFGTLAVTATDDQDDDGLDNLSEYRLGTDPTSIDSDRDGLEDGEELALGRSPTDYYDGREPTLQIVEGRIQESKVGTAGKAALVARILDDAGTTMPYAPATFSTADGSARLFTNADPTLRATISTRASNTGEASSASEFVFVVAPSVAGESINVVITAGAAEGVFTCVAVADDPPRPPLDFQATENANGTITVSWFGVPGPAQGIVIRRQEADGTWTVVAEIPVSQFPAPDADGRYTLTLPTP